MTMFANTQAGYTIYNYYIDYAIDIKFYCPYNTDNSNYISEFALYITAL